MAFFVAYTTQTIGAAFPWMRARAHSWVESKKWITIDLSESELCDVAAASAIFIYDDLMFFSNRAEQSPILVEILNVGVV